MPRTISDLWLVGHLGEGFRTIPAEMVLAPWIIKAPSEEAAVRTWIKHNVVFGGEEVIALRLPNAKSFSLGSKRGPRGAKGQE